MAQRTATVDVDPVAVAGALDRLLLWARRAAPLPMSSTSVTTLDGLAADGPQRVTDLARREGVAQPSMTTLVARLVAEGYVERVPHPRDGRSTLVAITAEGRRALAERHAARTSALAAAIARLAPEEQAALGSIAGPLHSLTRIITTEGNPA